MIQGVTPGVILGVTPGVIPGARVVRRLLAWSGLLLLLAAPAGAVDVSNLASVEDDPCFQQTHQRVLDSQLRAIESQIVAACTDARGNPTGAMALLTERAKAPPWLPPASGGMDATAVLLAVLVQLAILTALLGVDVSYAARALGMGALGVALPAAAVPGIVAVRALAAMLLTALAALPGLTVLAALGLLAFAVRTCRWRGPQPPAASPAEPAGRLAVGVGVLGTDLLANLPVSLGIAAASRGSPVLAVAGVLAAAGAARLLHPALARLLLRRPVLARAAGALIAAVAGLAALSDPGLAALGAMPVPLLLAVPGCLAVLALIAGRRPALRGPHPSL